VYDLRNVYKMLIDDLNDYLGTDGKMFQIDKYHSSHKESKKQQKL
jgi:hypothetical protein